MTFRQRVALLICIWTVLLGWGVTIGGASLFIVLHEPSNDDAAFSKLAADLQDESGPVSKAASDAGWTLWVLPDDAKDSNKQPLPILKSLNVYDSISDSTHEFLAIAPPSKLIAKQPIPAGASADDVLAMMKAKGKRK